MQADGARCLIMPRKQAVKLSLILKTSDSVMRERLDGYKLTSEVLNLEQAASEPRY